MRQQYATSFSPKKSKFTLFSMCQQTYFHIQFELLINFNQLVHVPENQAINQVYTCAPEIEPINLASPILLVVQGVNVKLFKFLTVSHRFMKGCNWHAFQKILKFAFLEITHNFFCYLQSNVFDATSLFQTMWEHFFCVPSWLFRIMWLCD